MNPTAVLCTLVATAGLLGASAILTAGPLNPPAGAVSSTYKTLGEVEPRIAINAANTPGDNDATPSVFKITTRGSYYMAGDVLGPINKIVIEVAASDVTIDLCGFTVAGFGSTAGVQVTLASRTDITVRNGHIQGMSGPGVSFVAGGNVTRNSRAEDVSVFNCTGSGIEPGENATVENCKVSNCGNGILAFRAAVVRGCTSRDNASSGIFVQEGTITDCSATDNGTAGIFVSERATVRGCTAARNATAGIQVANGSVVEGCSASNNTQSGIAATGNVSVIECTATGNGVHGISIANGSVQGCTASANTITGIVASGTGSVEGCTASANQGSGISTAGGTIVGCVASANVATGLAASGGVVRDCEARSNFTGISAGNGTTVTNCRAGSNGGTGIFVSSNCLIQGNLSTGNGTSTTGIGIYVSGDANRVERNNVVGNNWGIDCDGAVNLIIGNSARANNFGNYDVFTGNRVGTIFVPPLSGDISGNSGGAGMGTTDPWANIAF